MELYTLDSLFRYSSVIDSFQSLIWTERFSSWGDFELDTFSTLENRNLFVPGLRLSIKESKRVMVVETINDTTSDTGERILKVKGRSLEAIFENRMAMGDLTDLTEDPKWNLSGTPGDIIDQLFHDICVLGILNAGDIIPGVTEGSIYPADTIDAPSDEIIYEFEPTTLYLAIKNLADAYSMGFRLVRDPNTGSLYFDWYTGSDRTTGQTELAAVVFSPDMDNLKNTNKLTSSALYKNVAYVVSKVGHEIVYDIDIDPTINGFDRSVLTVVASDIDDPDPDIASAQMIQRGREELAKNRKLILLDGELAQITNYIYDTSYSLGDLVELQDDNGSVSNMQIVEQIFVSDKEGDRSYPSLAVNKFVTPGSWLDWDPTQEWEDLDSDPGTWSEQP